MLSQALSRYYEPLRLPLRPSAISASPYTHRLAVLPTTVAGLPYCTALLPLHATPATPGDPVERFRCL